MSTRCQIEFRNNGMRRTVYRHSDGYPSSVIPDLLAFLQWSTRDDVEYEAANFLYWSKRNLDEQQLGFGICANDELHGDIEYYYVVEHRENFTSVRAYAVAYERDGPQLGTCVQSVAVPAASFFSSATFKTITDQGSGVMALPRVLLHGVWYVRDDRLREFRRCDNPHQRITFDELLDAA